MKTTLMLLAAMLAITASAQTETPRALPVQNNQNKTDDDNLAYLNLETTEGARVMMAKIFSHYDVTILKYTNFRRFTPRDDDYVNGFEKMHYIYMGSAIISYETIYGEQVTMHIGLLVSPQKYLKTDEREFLIRRQHSSGVDGDNLFYIDDDVHANGMSLPAYNNLKTYFEAQQQHPSTKENRYTKEQRIIDPTESMVQRLTSHGIQYDGKVYTNGGDRNWTFKIKAPDGRSLGVTVPAGSSEKAIIREAYESTKDTGSVWDPTFFRQFLH